MVRNKLYRAYIIYGRHGEAENRHTERTPAQHSTRIYVRYVRLYLTYVIKLTVALLHGEQWANANSNLYAPHDCQQYCTIINTRK